jgi:S-DNA-T family DNA segregation ATPase FtsK/SpoIIIE
MASTKRNGGKRGSSKRKGADAPKERPQQFYDRVALVLVLLGLVALVSLTVPNSGVAGAALRDGLKLLFGDGAFLLPLVLWLAAGALVFGYGRLALPEVLSGGLIVYFALLGWLAQPSAQGNWFEAGALRASGGYLGAVIGYLLHLALGQAKGVVLGVLGVLGLLMLFNLPLAQVFRGVGRALWYGWRGASTATKAVASAASSTVSKASERAQRKAHERRLQTPERAVVAAPARAGDATARPADASASERHAEPPAEGSPAGKRDSRQPLARAQRVRQLHLAAAVPAARTARAPQTQSGGNQRENR